MDRGSEQQSHDRASNEIVLPGNSVPSLDDFSKLVITATGFAPYPYQLQLAEQGLPDLLVAPTGSGKTVAAVLPWLFRRRFHPNPEIRSETPHWLVVALPLRTLVDQVETVVTSWLTELDLTDDVGLHVLMGGRHDSEHPWTDAPEQDAIFVGSVDMLLSRALNRGYASGRFRWPIEFGMLNSGTQWVFDEVQLLGPSLPTSRQLQALRDDLGTVLPTSTMWMSATVDSSWMCTVDAPTVASLTTITNADRTGHLGTVTSAVRQVEELVGVDPKKPATIAEAVLERHRAGTRTICFVNTVDRARNLWKAIAKLSEVDCVLVHSRFRPRDRAAATDAALADPGVGGRIVVTTQAFEAGIDVSSTTLITEVAPWTSIVQRAGRCNRYGESDDAQLLWYSPAHEAPYSQGSLESAVEGLRALEGQLLTGESLATRQFEMQPVHPVIRRRDILELFDTTPTLSGDDIDISQYIRDDDERDVFIGWQIIAGDVPDPSAALVQAELCRVPLKDLKKWIDRVSKGTTRRIWKFDPEAEKWVVARDADIRPGTVLLADVTTGGYATQTGWDPTHRKPVEPVDLHNSEVDPDEASDQGAGADPLSQIGSWVTLADHLDDTKNQSQTLLAQLAPSLDPDMVDAIVLAAELHDIGKVHTVFQDTMLRSAGADEVPSPDELWAKSSGRTRSHHSRKHFRHEFVSALMLDNGKGITQRLGREADLVRYLVAAHHGRVRLGLPSLGGGLDSEDRITVLGVSDGESVPSITLKDGTTLAETTMNVEQAARLGGEGSWVRRTLPLLDRFGPFRLAWMEAIVRLADWAASRQPSRQFDVSASPEDL